VGRSLKDRKAVWLACNEELNHLFDTEAVVEAANLE